MRKFPNWALVRWWGVSTRKACTPISPFGLVLFGKETPVFCVSLHVNHVHMEVLNYNFKSIHSKLEQHVTHVNDTAIHHVRALIIKLRTIIFCLIKSNLSHFFCVINAGPTSGGIDISIGAPSEQSVGYHVSYWAATLYFRRGSPFGNASVGATRNILITRIGVPGP